MFLSSHQQARNENKILYVAMKKWGQGDYQDKTQNFFKAMRVQITKCEFLQVCSEGPGESLTDFFKVRGILKNIKIQTKLFHKGYEIFC